MYLMYPSSLSTAIDNTPDRGQSRMNQKVNKRRSFYKESVVFDCQYDSRWARISHFWMPKDCFWQSKTLFLIKLLCVCPLYFSFRIATYPVWIRLIFFTKKYCYFSCFSMNVWREYPWFCGDYVPFPTPHSLAVLDEYLVSELKIRLIPRVQYFTLK